MNEIDNFTEDGSGWVFISIVQLKIHTVKDEPMGGSSYIPLPKYLAKKEAIVSLKNNDTSVSNGLSLELYILLRETRSE